jgi:hypothetical protein
MPTPELELGNGMSARGLFEPVIVCGGQLVRELCHGWVTRQIEKCAHKNATAGGNKEQWFWPGIAFMSYQPEGTVWRRCSVPESEPFPWSTIFSE